MNKVLRSADEAVAMIPDGASIMVGGFGWPTDLAAHVELMLVGLLIMFFLIVEPHGLAQLWKLTKEKLRLWPFPH